MSNKFLTNLLIKQVFASIVREKSDKFFQNFLKLLKHTLEPKMVATNSQAIMEATAVTETAEHVNKSAELFIRSCDVYELLFSNFFIKSDSIQMGFLAYTLEVEVIINSS